MTTIEPIKSDLDFQVLTPEQRQQIKSATLRVLEEVGVRFPSDKALDKFAEYGIPVDRDTQVVKLPAEFVQDKMHLAPRNFLLAGRTTSALLRVGSGSSYFSTDGCGVECLDFETREVRPSRKEDVAAMARVSDYLSSIAFYWPMVSAQDYGNLAPLHELDASYNNTIKHVQTETVMGSALARYAVEIARVVAGDEESLRKQPPLSSLVCTIAPLTQDKAGIEAAMVFAEAGLPVGFMAMPTMGSTSPAAPGGALTIGNAETVSAMVLMQLVSPGAPVFQSLLVSAMDPQSAEYLVTLPEKYLCNAAAIQMAHDWGVPALAGSFGLEHAEPATWQLGRDSVYSALFCALASTDLSIGLGLLQASTLLVPEQIIFDDEIYHAHRILASGLDTSPGGVALDVIQAVGPGGHFLAQKHTRAHIRSIWLPELSRPRISTNGADIQKRARAKLERILSDHEPPPLEAAAQAEIKLILQKAEQQIGR